MLLLRIDAVVYVGAEFLEGGGSLALQAVVFDDSEASRLEIGLDRPQASRS
jgi:hypothetical protein